MKLLLSFAALAVLATFTLASETASPQSSPPPPPEASEFLHQLDQNTTLQKNVQKSTTYYCSSYDDCKSLLGIYSSCNSHSRCVCDMGYERKGLLGTCQKVSCSSNNDCSKFGLHTHCSSGYCYCDSSYTYDLTEEKCLFDTSDITTTYYCNSYDNCKPYLGIYSSCNSAGRCVCDMGYERKGPLGICQKVSCSANNDCSKFGLHTHCSSGYCYCDSSYTYVLTEEKCRQTDNGIHDYYYSRPSNNYGLIFGLPITIVGLIIILVAILLVRKKRLREEAVRRAAAIQRGVAQQGATVVINRQQANLQPAYNYPQNPLQNPPQNPTFTGYQPQPPPYYQQQPPQPETNPHVINNSGHYPTSTFQNHYKN